jgi:L-amino acid N-acyltransferase YncA
MSLEYAIEKYPITARLKNGDTCVVRPLKPEDQKSVLAFYERIPPQERGLLNHPKSDDSLFHEWTESLDMERDLPLLALLGNRVIGEGVLHQRSGWKSHIGLVSILIDPEYREQDLSSILCGELVHVARHFGLARLEAEFNGDRETALKSFAMEGFEELARVPRYVHDTEANFHDYVLMGMELLTREEYASQG